MRTIWRIALIVTGVMTVSPSAVDAQDQTAAAAVDQSAIVDALQAAPAPRRVRGFNTAQLLDWLDSQGKPLPMHVTCPVSTGEIGQPTQFGCAVALMATNTSGSTLHRLVVFWSDLQPDNASQFDEGWKKYQAVIDALAHFGVTRLIITPVGSPNWARSMSRQTAMTGRAKYAHPDLDHLDDWTNFLGELARHVSPLGFEIGNEQNTNNFWDPIKNKNHVDETPSPDDYAQLYCAAVDGISRFNPDARIGIGGLAPIRTSNPTGGHGGDKTMEASEFVRKSIGAGVGGAKCRLNFIGYHPYLTNEYCTRNTRNLPIARTRGIAELSILHRENPSQKIWITEWGFPSRPYTQGGTTCSTYSAREQARLIRLEHDYLARLSYTAYSGYFNLVDDDTPNQNGSIGLICSNFTVKRSFNTWRQLNPPAPGSPLATGACKPKSSPAL